MSTFTLPSIPTPLDWQIAPLDYEVDPALTIKSGPKTDWFIDPNRSEELGTAPNALFAAPDTNFTLSAKVTVDFAATYDAGVLRIHERDDLWAKLCFEYSPQGHPTIVSVVTRGYSDDCNSVQISGNTVHLRLTRLGDAFAFHYSLDGHYWHLVRYFTLGKLQLPQFGFSSQSPTGTGCTAVFADIQYQARKVADLRNGE